MARRNSNLKRKQITPDIKYNSVLVAKFINKLMEDGEKSIAEKIFYKALETIEKKHKLNPLEVFNTAMSNVRPYIQVTSVRVGGANYQVPSPVDEKRSHSLASTWLITFAKKRSEQDMIAKLAGEIFDAYNSRGSSYKKKEDTHKMAESNRAFSHYSARKTAKKKQKLQNSRPGFGHQPFATPIIA